MSKVAMCHRCKEPLVFTYAFSGKEFVCVKCGRTYTYFGPDGADETPELLARIEANNKRWKEISEGVLTGGVMLTRCLEAGGACVREPHLYHATDEELAAHNRAIDRIRKLGVTHEQVR